jgi:hypothetical protein
MAVLNGLAAYFSKCIDPFETAEKPFRHCDTLAKQGLEKLPLGVGRNDKIKNKTEGKERSRVIKCQRVTKRVRDIMAPSVSLSSTSQPHIVNVKSEYHDPSQVC